MKLKASVKKLGFSKLFPAFAAVCIALTGLRVYQMFALTDPSTGFFTDKSNVTVILFYILWLVTVLGSMLLFYLSPSCETGAYAARKNIPHAAASVLMAAGAAYDAYSRFSDMRAGMGGMSLMTYIKAERAYIGFAAVLFAVLTAVVFLIDAAGFITGGSFVSSLKVCHLFPVLWMFCGTVGYFSITVSYLNVAQLMLMIFSDAFLMVFFFEYARFLTDTAAEEAPWLVFASGVCAFILQLAYVAPDIALMAAKKPLTENCPLHFYSITAIIFIATALITAARNRNHIAVTFEPAEVPEAADAAAEAADTDPESEG